MFRKSSIIARAGLALVVLTYSSLGLAQEKLEGMVTGTKLTMCKFEPGGCAGSLALDIPRAGKMEPVTIQIPLGTPIKNGKEYTYLPALRGNVVTIVYTDTNGERVAKSVDVKILKK